MFVEYHVWACHVSLLFIIISSYFTNCKRGTISPFGSIRDMTICDAFVIGVDFCPPLCTSLLKILHVTLQPICY